MFISFHTILTIFIILIDLVIEYCSRSTWRRKSGAVFVQSLIYSVQNFIRLHCRPATEQVCMWTPNLGSHLMRNLSRLSRYWLKLQTLKRAQIRLYWSHYRRGYFLVRLHVKKFWLRLPNQVSNESRPRNESKNWLNFRALLSSRSTM